MTLTYRLPTHAGVPLAYGALKGASLAYVLANLLAQSGPHRLIITPDSLSAQQLEAELSFFGANAVGVSSVQTAPILSFPDWETLPYDSFSPHPDLISQRLKTLSHLVSGQPFTLIIPLGTAMHYIASAHFVRAGAFHLKCQDVLDLTLFRQALADRGYRSVHQVYEHGEFAVRGSIIDLYPMGHDEAYRIELWDNTIESIRTFDPETQRSSGQITAIDLLPALEFPFDELAIRRFRQAWRDHFSGNPALSPLYQQVSEGRLAGGIEYYLPLFFEKPGLLFDYLPVDTLVVRVGDLATVSDQFWQSVQQRYQHLALDRTRPCLPPEQLFLPPEKLLYQLKSFNQIQLSSESLVGRSGFVFDLALDEQPDLRLNHQHKQPLVALENYLLTQSHRVLFTVESPGRQALLLERLAHLGIKPLIVNSWQAFRESQAPYAIAIADIVQGFALPSEGFICIAENQFLGIKVPQSRRQQKRTDPDQAIRHLAELSLDSPIVHLDHGVGRYRGLTLIKTGQIENEYLTIEYAGGDRLYVPVTALHLISRYAGFDPDQAPWHRLGGGQWDKAKQRAVEQVRDVAAELLTLYAKREAREGFSFLDPDKDYQTFVAGFPFEETTDQLAAIEAVIQDMTRPKPMDRLVCGDVGFGKTEVAMRAAFLAVQSSKQVAILVPTTLLAQQHYDNFKDRFADWPIEIAVLSRFQSAKKSKEIKERAKAGQVDILIGTHKLLQEGFDYPRLGLVIIDEEHRFGVHQKEKLKTLRTEVDLLTLTATPIPRTLNMAVAGLRSLSIIATPPAKRLSVKTFVHERNDYLIREAVLREILRGGQVYFLHNSVDTIHQVAEALAKLLPEAKINMGHGQMKERDLERVMSDFYHQRFNVLVCTTIVETGIDIPTANTMIIDRADKFGLAQLHQLRGRVGRSHHQAYAYLLTPPEKSLTADAKKRLQAIATYDDLGVGFVLATHDLEIRGAGELLGDNQSGEIQSIGFHLYSELLDKTVQALKKGQVLDEVSLSWQGAEVELGLPAFIPEAYVGDVHERLVLYKRLAEAKSAEALDQLRAEWIDRFGPLPVSVQTLFDVTSIKLRAEIIGIKKLEAQALGGRIEFFNHTTVDPRQLIELIQRQSHTYQLEGPARLKFKLGSETAIQRVAVVNTVLSALGPQPA